MYILKKNTTRCNSELSLRELLQKFLDENEILVSSIASEIKVHIDTLQKFLSGETDLKFMQAIRIMKILGLTDEELISSYSKNFDIEAEKETLENLEEIAFVTQNFNIPELKKMGIISPRAKLNEYATYICKFFNFSSIYQYNDTSLTPTLFSKSRRKVLAEKESKMTNFWLKCAIHSFNQIGNPHEYDKELLTQLIKRSSEFTKDTVYGYYRFILVLYQLGITVLTQPYTTKTKAFGGTLVLNGKPCIIITDMGKKYHKLWLSLMHELYHVINDYEMLETMEYHFSTPNEPDLLINEEKADQFALDILIHPSIQENLAKIIDFPIKVKALANELGVADCIIYGVYLEGLPNGPIKNNMFARLSKYLLPSEIATKNILFDPIKKRSLENAIETMRNKLTKAVI